MCREGGTVFVGLVADGNTNRVGFLLLAVVFINPLIGLVVASLALLLLLLLLTLRRSLIKDSEFISTVSLEDEPPLPP